MDWVHFWTRSFENLHRWRFTHTHAACVCAKESALEIAFIVRVSKWVQRFWLPVMSVKSVSFSMGYTFLSSYSPDVPKMCDAFHMWIDRHRESLCSIYSFHSQRLQKHTCSQPIHSTECTSRIHVETGVYSIPPQNNNNDGEQCNAQEIFLVIQCLRKYTRSTT